MTDDLPHDLDSAVEGGDVQRGHIILALLVQVSLARNEALHAREVVALHGLDHVHSQLANEKKKNETKRNEAKRNRHTKT